MANVLILTYWSYPDALIQTYTLPYVRMIRKTISSNSEIFLLTLEKNKMIGKDGIEEVLKTEKVNWIPVSYTPFGIMAFVMWAKTVWKLLKLIRNERVEVLHCWCTPAGAIGYILSILTGKKLVVDSYEPHAEAMAENGTWRKNGIPYRLLFWLEKKQTARASCLISATEGMRQYAKEKFRVDIKKFYVKPACVNLDLFSLDNIKRKDILSELDLNNKIVGVYAGKFGGIYLDKEVFDFFVVAANYWKDSFRVLLLTNAPREEIIHYCEASGLNPSIVITRFVAHHEIPAYIGVGDFALTFVKPVPSKKYCTPIKDGEYWALGLPVVIPANISDDSQIIEKNNIGAVLKELNPKAYLTAVEVINNLIADPDARKRVRRIAETYRNFKIAESIYKELYDNNV